MKQANLSTRSSFTKVSLDGIKLSEVTVEKMLKDLFY